MDNAHGSAKPTPLGSDRSGFTRFIGNNSVNTARSYDLLTDDHPYRWYANGERARFNPLLRGVVFGGILLVSMFILIFVGTIIAVIVAPNAFFNADGTSTNMTVVLGEALDTSSPLVQIVSIAEILGALIAYLVVVRVMEGRKPPLELSLKRAPGALLGIVTAFVCITVSVGIIALLGGYRITGFNAGYQPWADLLTLGLAAGIAEEIMMRGILLRLFEEVLGSWGAVALSALIFGFLHLGNKDGSLWGAIAIALEAGLLFGAIYLATRSLWWCMGFHFMWNVAEGPIFGSIVSGNGEQRSWFTANWSGSDWLTGGAFGLEASVVPVILLTAVAVALLIHLQRQGRMIEPVWVRKRRLFAAAAAAAAAQQRQMNQQTA